MPYNTDSNLISKEKTLLRLATQLGSLETLHMRMENITAVALSNFDSSNIYDQTAIQPVFTRSEQYEMIFENTPNLLRLTSGSKSLI